MHGLIEILRMDEFHGRILLLFERKKYIWIYLLFENL